MFILDVLTRRCPTAEQQHINEQRYLRRAGSQEQSHIQRSKPWRHRRLVGLPFVFAGIANIEAGAATVCAAVYAP
jgi:hypothetical protein